MGRASEGQGSREGMGSSWQQQDSGPGQRLRMNAISLLCRVKSRPWPGFPRSRERDGPGPWSRR